VGQFDAHANAPRRLPTTGFSKKDRAAINAVALHFMNYNLMRIRSLLRMTTAMAADVTGKLREIDDIVALIGAKEAERPMKRGPYKKQTAA
jgi:hypothetical protein